MNSKKTNTELHEEKLMQDLNVRAEYALLEMAERLAAEIKELRESMNLSQSQMAKEMGTTQSQISRLEDPDYARYSLLSLAKLADVFNCSLNVSFEKSCDLSKAVPTVSNSIIDDVNLMLIIGGKSRGKETSTKSEIVSRAPKENAA